MEDAETEAGAEIKNEEAREVVKSAQAKVVEVEVKKNQRESEAEAGNVATSAVEVKVRNAEHKAEVRSKEEAVAGIEVGLKIYIFFPIFDTITILAHF